MTRYDNPYATTSVVSERPYDRVGHVSYLFAAVAVAAALAYVAFTIVLFFSGPGDRIGGMMFLTNIPAFIGLAVSAFRSTRVSVHCASAGFLVQSGITVAMLLMQYGDTAIVIGVNSAIILPCLLMAVWAWWLSCRPCPAM